MSHFTTIKTQIKDLAALGSALTEMGLSMAANSEARGYLNNKLKGDYVIQLQGPYDLALQIQPNGSYALVADWYQGHVEKEVGKNCSKLLQLYGVHKTMREARQKGYSVQRSNQSNGAIKLVVLGA